MVKKFLKIAGVKTEADFYKKYPSEAAFFKAHPEAKHLKKMKQGGQQKKLNQLTNWTNDVDNIIPTAQGGVKLDIWGNPIPMTQMAENPNAGTGQIGLNNPAGGTMPMSGNNSANNPFSTYSMTYGAPTTNPIKEGYVPGGQTPDSIKGIASQKLGFSTGTLEKGLGLVGAGIKYAKQREQEKYARDLANQTSQVTGVQSKAAKSVRQEPIKNINWHPWDNPIQQDTLFPSQGGRQYQGNVLAQFGTKIGGNPSEIQNTYNPGNLYSDLGFEPLNDSNQVKQYYHGGGIPQAFGGFFGGTNPAGQAAGQFADAFGSLGEQNAGSGLGKAIGSTAGSLLGPVGGKIGGAIGGIIGGALDRMPGQTKAYEEQSRKNEESILGQQFGNTVHTQFGRVMEDGGWVSHDWQPQVIATFGEHKMSDLLRSDPSMDTLRTGGHITQNNIYPQDQYALGGSLKTTWGGYAEPISHNPHDDSETVMFRGKSHQESDGNGHTGIGVKYGQPHDSYTDYAEFGTKNADADVEVERNEPAMEMRDPQTGEKNMLVFGDLIMPKQFLSSIDVKAETSKAVRENMKNKKFKNYVADIAKQENKLNKLVEKSTEQLNNLKSFTPMDKLRMNALQANLYGANQKLGDYSQIKRNAAGVQTALHDTAEEHGLDVVALAKGKNVKSKVSDKNAKHGKKMMKAQTGLEYMYDEAGTSDIDLLGGGYGQSNLQRWPSLENRQTSASPVKVPIGAMNGPFIPMLDATTPAGVATSEPMSFNMTSAAQSTPTSKNTNNFTNEKEIADYYKSLGYTGSGTIDDLQKWILKKAKEDPKVDAELESYLRGVDTTNKGKKLFGKKKKPSELTKEQLYEQFNDKLWSYRFPKLESLGYKPNEIPVPKIIETETKPTEKSTVKPVQPNPRNPFIDFASQIVPALRPSNQEAFDYAQLYPEIQAKIRNVQQPVQAQQYNPQLLTPYNISLQDQLNEVTAQGRAAERMAGNDPAAAAALLAQVGRMKGGIQGEEFRQNQAQRMGIYNQNINTLNDAQLKNLAIIAQQADKQALAKSKTDQQNDEINKSVALKIAQHNAANRQLGIYENMYNYRFDPVTGRAINYNAPYQFDTAIGGSTSSSKGGLAPGYEFTYDASGNIIGTRKTSKKDDDAKNGTKLKERNGAIVNALKNL